ncbi:MAG: hypothetical protein WAL98_22560 [Desulfatiglandaceae bacterium]
MKGMYLKRRHFGPGTGQWKGRNPQRPESWTTEGVQLLEYAVCLLRGVMSSLPGGCKSGLGGEEPRFR